MTTPMRPKGWSARRTARLGFLLGLGWDAARIGRDAIVAATPAEVHRQTEALSLCFRQPVEGSPLNLSAPRMAYYEAEAKARGVPAEALLRRLLEVVADDRVMLGPLIDPGRGR